MKKPKITLFLFVFILFFACVEMEVERIPGFLSDTVLKYDNNIGLLPEIADPYVLEYEGKYYLYATDDVWDIAKQGVKVYVSRNLVEWSPAKGVHPEGRALYFDDSWYRTDHVFTCPEVYHQNGTFYMFYVVDGRIAIAKSSSPLGPFEQDIKKPLTQTDAIDPHLFVDDDGKTYLYYVAFDKPGNQIYVQEMDREWKEFTGSKTLCIDFSQDWEHADPHYKQENGVPIIEGPYLLKHKGIYYLVYSANHFLSANHYAVGYATSTSPLGPWEKFEGNPILKPTNKIKGTGHNAFAYSPDSSLYIVYHTHKDLFDFGPRKLAIDSCAFIPQSDPSKPDELKVFTTDTLKQVSWKKEFFIN